MPTTIRFRPGPLQMLTEQTVESCKRFAGYSKARKKNQLKYVDENYRSRLRDAYRNLHGEDLDSGTQHEDWKYLTFEEWQEIINWILFLEKEVCKYKSLDRPTVRGELKMTPKAEHEIKELQLLEEV